MAVHIMTALAYVPDEHHSSAWLARSVNTNPVVIRRVLADLVNEGLVQPVHGSKGGFELTRPAQRITLLDIYRAVAYGSPENSLHKNAVHASCAVSRNVRRVLLGHLARAGSAYERELQKTRLSDVLQEL